MKSILLVEGPEGFGAFLQPGASVGEELKLINDKDKPIRLGDDFWIWPGDEIHIKWQGERWETIRHFRGAVATHED